MFNTVVRVGIKKNVRVILVFFVSNWIIRNYFLFYYWDKEKWSHIISSHDYLFS
ncbi:hypothetical protein JHK86_055130 [Glycine max]|nr:hypothetical protein JHK86_055130 [Glycine max]